MGCPAIPQMRPPSSHSVREIFDTPHQSRLRCWMMAICCRAGADALGAGGAQAGGLHDPGAGGSRMDGGAARARGHFVERLAPTGMLLTAASHRLQAPAENRRDSGAFAAARLRWGGLPHHSPLLIEDARTAPRIMLTAGSGHGAVGVPLMGAGRRIPRRGAHASRPGCLSGRNGFDYVARVVRREPCRAGYRGGSGGCASGPRWRQLGRPAAQQRPGRYRSRGVVHV
jgi:hypothetical protein